MPNPKIFVKRFPKYLQKRLPREITVISISAKESRRLNLLYREKNKPTNVLSFRYGPEYGEILICPEIVKQEAKAQGNSQKYQMTRMIVHGMMHLGGMHHEGGRTQERHFIRLEGQILENFLEKQKMKNEK